MLSRARSLSLLTTSVVVLLCGVPSAHAAWDMTVSSAPTNGAVSVSPDGQIFTAVGNGANVDIADFQAATLDGPTTLSAGSSGAETGNITFEATLSLGPSNVTAIPGAAGSLLTPVGSSFFVNGSLHVQGAMTARGNVYTTTDMTVTGDTTTIAPNLSVYSQAGAVSLQRLDSTASSLSLGGDTVTVGGSVPIVGGGYLAIAATGGITLATPQLSGQDLFMTGPVTVPMDLNLFGTQLQFGGGAVTGVGSPSLTTTNGIDVTFPSQGSSGFGDVVLNDAATTVAVTGPLNATGAVAINDLQLSYATTITSGGAATFGTIQGPGASLTVNGPGATTFVGATSLVNLTTDAAGTTAFSTAPTVSGTITVNDHLLLSSNLSFGASQILLLGGIDGVGAGRQLTTSAATRVRLVGAIGATTPLASISTNSAGGVIELNTSLMNFTGSGTMFGNVVLVGDTHLGPYMSVNGTINGAHALTGGTIVAFGAIGNVTRPASINLSGNLVVFQNSAVNGDVTASIMDFQASRTFESVSGTTTARITTAGASVAEIRGTSNLTMFSGHQLVLAGSGTTTAAGTIAPTLTIVRHMFQVPTTRTVGAIQLESGGVSGAGATGTIVGTNLAAGIDPATPTGGIATLSTGSLSGSWTYGPKFDSAAADQIAVTGTVAINGFFYPQEVAAFAVGVERTIIANDGTDAVTGTFISHPEGTVVTMASGAMYRISYVGGTGNDVTLTRVVHASSTGLTQSSVTSDPGGAVTFTANVSGGSNGTPTGTVTFRDNGAAIGTATLTSGSAQLTTTSLASGTHSITATYDGDVRFDTSSSSAVTHTVSTPPAPPADPTPSPPADPTPTPPAPSPAIAPPALTMSDRCVVAGVDDPMIAFLLSRRAKVTYSVQRRVRPAVASNRRGACARQVSPTTSTVTPRYRVLTSVSRIQAAGRVRTTLGTLLGERELAAGVYRVAITIRASGARTRTAWMSFVVVERR